MKRFYCACGKRIFDIIFSATILIIVSPILITALLAIILIDGRLPIFKQKRVGQHKKNFNILKLRTMDQAPEPLQWIGDESRASRLGKFLRKYKIDELPQLINVLKGEMSLVGHRPELPARIDNMSKCFDDVFDTKPGVTSSGSIIFAQEYKLLPKNKLLIDSYYDEHILPIKLKLAQEYNNNISFMGDLKIIYATTLCLGRIIIGKN